MHLIVRNDRLCPEVVWKSGQFLAKMVLVSGDMEGVAIVHFKSSLL